MIPNDRAFNGKPMVEAEGKVFYRTYRIERQGTFRVRIRVAAINSTYYQGLAIGFTNTPAFQGSLQINGQKFVPEKRKRLNYVLPLSLPDESECIFDLDIKDGYFMLANASDYLDDYPEMIERLIKQTGRTREQFRGNSYASGFTAANMYGNAFWIEQLSDTCQRFHCNDHKMDDDFDDLIFDMEIIEVPAEK